MPNNQSTVAGTGTKRYFMPVFRNCDSLKASRMAECVYDVTCHFARHQQQKGDRTLGQTVSAARSGNPNIASGKDAGTALHEAAIKLVNAARARLRHRGGGG